MIILMSIELDIKKIFPEIFTLYFVITIFDEYLFNSFQGGWRRMQMPDRYLLLGNYIRIYVLSPS